MYSIYEKVILENKIKRKVKKMGFVKKEILGENTGINKTLNKNKSE